MDKTRLETRRKIESICNVKEFDDLMERVMLSDKIKSAMRMHYIDDKDFRYIADVLGYTESTIKRWHSDALDKISSLL